MKKVINSLIFLFFCVHSHATELHIESIIVNFPCLANVPSDSANVTVYSCITGNSVLQLQIIKDDSLKEYKKIISGYVAGFKGKLIKQEERIFNDKKVMYFSFSFKKGNINYLSESMVYIDKKSTYHMNSVRNETQLRSVDTEYFFNSLIIIK